jgi:starvation-inducible DNA-binding protein
MTHHHLPQDTRDAMIALLNQQLADGFDLFSQAKQAHWNVKGMTFIALHQLFDDLAESLEGMVDTLAERVTALGGTAKGTARMAAQASRLPEMDGTPLSAEKAVCDLAERISAYGHSTREAIDTATDAGDAATADLFTEMVRDLDKHLYFLDAHLGA